ncbi:hypothetical protein [Prosthecomicrobium hirschii]|uniref:hypothetical protein n=1 Tax=Prosthecodimorpha hirschii TaxID=665126 RepID=UPI00221FF39D|nr:hypothetical protein [Prosthecomicrobium hirschii]MCW1841327.1 hypothetical protein [Prosthecomicrobium hirschii]
MKRIAVAGCYLFSCITSCFAQSQIETVFFLMTGLEIRADGSSWAGELENHAGKKKTFSIKQVDSCIYQFENSSAYPGAIEEIDFSKVPSIDIRPQFNGYGVSFHTFLNGLDGAMCFKGKSGVFALGCRGPSNFALQYLETGFTDGDPKVNWLLARKVNTIADAKNRYYARLRTFCPVNKK